MSSDVQCAECGVEAPPNAAGWKADIAADVDDDEPPYVAMFCAECWEREFGLNVFYEATQHVYDEATAHLPS